MTPISEIQRACLYIYKKQKNANRFKDMQKSRHFAKSKTIYNTFLFTKGQTLYVTQFSMQFLKLVFIYTQKAWNFALREGFIYKNPVTSKNQDNLRCICLYTKSLTRCFMQFFMESLKLAEGGGHFIDKKKALWATFLYTKSQLICVTFLFVKNNALCVTFLYLKFIVYILYSDNKL